MVAGYCSFVYLIGHKFEPLYPQLPSASLQDPSKQPLKSIPLLAIPKWHWSLSTSQQESSKWLKAVTTGKDLISIPSPATLTKQTVAFKHPSTSSSPAIADPDYKMGPVGISHSAIASQKLKEEMRVGTHEINKVKQKSFEDDCRLSNPHAEFCYGESWLVFQKQVWEEADSLFTTLGAPLADLCNQNQLHHTFQASAPGLSLDRIQSLTLALYYLSQIQMMVLSPKTRMRTAISIWMLSNSKPWLTRKSKLTLRVIRLMTACLHSQLPQ